MKDKYIMDRLIQKKILVLALSFFIIPFEVYAITPAEAECAIITNPESGLSAYQVHDFTQPGATYNYVDSVHNIPGQDWWLLMQVRQRETPLSIYLDVFFYLDAYDLETDTWERVDIAGGDVYTDNTISGVQWNTSFADLEGTNCDTWAPDPCTDPENDGTCEEDIVKNLGGGC